jgi:hypothetical protein
MPGAFSRNQFEERSFATRRNAHIGTGAQCRDGE